MDSSGQCNTHEPHRIKTNKTDTDKARHPCRLLLSEKHDIILIILAHQMEFSAFYPFQQGLSCQLLRI